jgi:hypothetical protein
MAEGRRSGRTTPKKSTAAGAHTTPPGRTTAPSARYTPPIPRDQKVSPRWVPVLMFALLGLGVITIVLNYVNLLPGDANNGYLLLGLGFITGGFITATNFH